MNTPEQREINSESAWFTFLEDFLSQSGEEPLPDSELVERMAEAWDRYGIAGTGRIH